MLSIVALCFFIFKYWFRHRLRAPLWEKKKTLPIYSQHPLDAIVGWTPINYFILGIISIQDF